MNILKKAIAVMLSSAVLILSACGGGSKSEKAYTTFDRSKLKLISSSSDFDTVPEESYSYSSENSDMVSVRRSNESRPNMPDISEAFGTSFTYLKTVKESNGTTYDYFITYFDMSIDELGGVIARIVMNMEDAGYTFNTFKNTGPQIKYMGCSYGSAAPSEFAFSVVDTYGIASPSEYDVIGMCLMLGVSEDMYYTSGKGVPGMVGGMTVCYACGGTKKCSICGGTGNLGYLYDYKECSACNGTGRCDICGGTGYH